MAEDEPPPGVPPWLHRLFSRWLGFFTVYLMLAAAATVIIGLALLVVVLVAQI